MEGLAAKLMDNDYDVRTETIRALSVYGTHGRWTTFFLTINIWHEATIELCRSETKSPILTLIKKLVAQLKDVNTSRESVQALAVLSKDGLSASPSIYELSPDIPV